MSEIRLNDSKLGSQQYWNDFYRREIDNFAANDEDTGECWFDDSNAEQKVVDFFTSLVEESAVSESAKVLDLGTGNGHFLFELYENLLEEVPQAKLEYCGVDYSPESVEFASLIAGKKYPEQPFDFQTVDFLSQSCDFLVHHKGNFDVLFDKGTLDAIALNNEPVPGFGEMIGTQVYPGQVIKLMHAGSLLIVTSCNFTEDELISVVTEKGANCLQVWRKIAYPSFQFGGAKGSTICSIAFIKNT